MTIHIELRSVYGETKAYPACPKAEIFALMAGTKTLTSETLALIRALGFTIRPVSAHAQELARFSAAA